MLFHYPPPALIQVLFIAKRNHYGPYLLQLARGHALGLADSDRHLEGGPCGVEIDILG